MVRLKALTTSQARFRFTCFNSLMVRLKVKAAFNLDWYLNGFQFLDGAIKRQLTHVVLLRHLWFQFLDGAIKSKYQYNPSNDSHDVSIP